MAKNITTLGLDNNEFTLRPYVICNTAGSTTAKTASVADFELFTGATVCVKFTYANATDNPTLNINNTGAKYIDGSNLLANKAYEFLYDGNKWLVLNADVATKYLPLTGGQITDSLEVVGTIVVGLDTGMSITIGSSEITVGSDISIGSGEIKIGTSSSVTIGSGEIKIGTSTDTGVTIGTDIKIGSNVIVGTDIRIGSNIIVGTGIKIGPDVIAGYSDILIGGSEIKVGSDVTIGGTEIKIGSDMSINTGGINVGSNATLRTPKIQFERGYISDDALVLGDEWVNMDKSVVAIGTITTETLIKGNTIKILSNNPIMFHEWRQSGITQRQLYIDTEFIKFINDGEIQNSFSCEGLQYPLTIKYNDKVLEYRGGKPTTTQNNTFDLNEIISQATSEEIQNLF